MNPQVVMKKLDVDFLVSLVEEYPVLYSNLFCSNVEVGKAWTNIGQRLGYNNAVCQAAWTTKKQGFLNYLQQRRDGNMEVHFEEVEQMGYLLPYIQNNLASFHPIVVEHVKESTLPKYSDEITTGMQTAIACIGRLPEQLRNNDIYQHLIEFFQNYIITKNFTNRFPEHSHIIVDISSCIIWILLKAKDDKIVNRERQLFNFIKFFLEHCLYHIERSYLIERIDRIYDGYAISESKEILEECFEYLNDTLAFYNDLAHN